jgi:predicted DNA-binding transcriptional regulator AlpA
MAEKMLRTAELAARLNVSVRTLEGWRYHGTGPPAVRLSPKAVRYPEAEVERWLAERTDP